MLFQTPEFALLFLATIAAFYVLAPRFRLRVLAVSSLGFYAASGILDFFLLLSTVLVAYLLSRKVKQDGSRWPIFGGVLLLIVSLVYFKYGEFAYESVRNWFGATAWVDRPGFLLDFSKVGLFR